jgi:hypothetical protein
MLSIQTQVNQGGIGEFFSLEGTFLNASKIPSLDPVVPGGERVFIAGNIISGEGGYDKPGYLDKYIAVKHIDAKLVILLDDGAVNILNMMDHYKDPRRSAIQFIGFHVPQYDNPAHAPLIDLLKDPGKKEKRAKAEGLKCLEPGEVDAALKVAEIHNPGHHVPAEETKSGTGHEGKEERRTPVHH